MFSHEAVSPLSPLFPTSCLASTLREVFLSEEECMLLIPSRTPIWINFKVHVVSEAGGLKGHLKSTEFTEADVWRIWLTCNN